MNDELDRALGDLGLNLDHARKTLKEIRNLLVLLFILGIITLIHFW